MPKYRPFFGKNLKYYQQKANISTKRIKNGIKSESVRKINEKIRNQT
ncbi:MAG: hypothetical protein RI924_675 [Bacteroidota bacterium]